MTRLAVLTLLVSTAIAYPSGPPSEACESMLPGHGATPLSGTPPYELQLSASCYRINEPLQVTIVTTSDNFKGFFAQARAPRNTTALGAFTTDDTDHMVMNCGQGIENAVGHSNSIGKEDASFTFSADKDYGQIVINTTIVRSFRDIFVNVTSAPIRLCTTTTTTSSTTASLSPTGSTIYSTTTGTGSTTDSTTMGTGSTIDPTTMGTGSNTYSTTAGSSTYYSIQGSSTTDDLGPTPSAATILRPYLVVWMIAFKTILTKRFM